MFTRHAVISLSLLLFVALAAPACGSDTDNGGSTDNSDTASSDGAGAQDDGATGDVTGQGDALQGDAEQSDAGTTALDAAADVSTAVENPCIDEIKDALPAKETVAKTAVSTTQTGDTYTTLVDATAGGFGKSHLYPWVYISFDTGGRVEISDVDALSDPTGWHMAFKRAAIRINSGDSGPGTVGAFSLAADFDQIKGPPAMATYKTDIFMNENCEATLDPINNLKTTFASWYNYGSNNKVTPKPGTWVLRLPGKSGGKSRYVKLNILNYYGQSGTTSANYVLKWSWL